MDIQEFLRTNNQHVTKLKRTLGCTCADHAKFQEKRSTSKVCGSKCRAAFLDLAQIRLAEKLSEQNIIRSPT